MWTAGKKTLCKTPENFLDTLWLCYLYRLKLKNHAIILSLKSERIGSATFKIISPYLKNVMFIILHALGRHQNCINVHINDCLPFNFIIKYKSHSITFVCLFMCLFMCMFVCLFCQRVLFVCFLFVCAVCVLTFKTQPVIPSWLAQCVGEVEFNEGFGD